MKEKAKKIGCILFVLCVFSSPVRTLDLHSHELEASDIHRNIFMDALEKKRMHSDLKDEDGLTRILIVPGHDDETWGAEFGEIKEVHLNRELSKNIYSYLSKEDGIHVELVSDEFGYSSIFKKYFKKEEKGIKDFINKSKKSFSERVKKEEIESFEKKFHNHANKDTVFKLYAINRWLNDQDFDLVIHVHFNDHAGREPSSIGDHTGFSIYTPGPLFKNYNLSKVFAESIFQELKKVQTVSTLKTESQGIVEGHELIALGANDTLDAGSLLIEYGYIYEDKITDPVERKIVFDYFAYHTYTGIKKVINKMYFSKKYLDIDITKIN